VTTGVDAAARTRRAARSLALVSAGTLGLCLILGAAQPRAVVFSYLVAYTYCAGLGLGALVWLMTLYAAGARWGRGSRPLLETLSSVGPLFALLFAPIAWQARALHPWASAPLPPTRAHLAGWLATPWFAARGLLCLVAWSVIAALLCAASARADEQPRAEARARVLSGGALPLVALLISLMAFDWLMALEPAWGSSLFGLYVLVGHAVAALALWIAALALAERLGLAASPVPTDEYHHLGKLLLAFICVWAYLAFSQALLIWIADKPDEVPWYVTRGRGAWGRVAALLVVGHFVVPFFLLLSRALKRRRGTLAAVAVWLLAMRYLDLYWIEMPALTPRAPAPRLSDLLALVGVGAGAAALALARLDVTRLGGPPEAARDRPARDASRDPEPAAAELGA
jgi:hypothetical protein